MANTLNCHVIFLQIWKQQKTEAEALNFRVLMDCLNQESVNKLKEVMSLNVYKRNSCF